MSSQRSENSSININDESSMENETVVSISLRYKLIVYKY